MLLNGIHLRPALRKRSGPGQWRTAIDREALCNRWLTRLLKTAAGVGFPQMA